MNFRRLASGIGANAFDKLVIAGVQLALVPVLSIHWGLAVYGGWVMLSTVPSFLAVSDLGFAGAAANEMAMLAARDERERVVQVFQSAWAVMLVSSAVMLIIGIIIVDVFPTRWLPLAPGFGASEARVTLAALMLYGLVALQGSIVSAGLRCAGFYSIGMMYAGLTILLENSVVGIVVVNGASPFRAAILLLIIRSLCLGGQALLLRRRVAWLPFGLAHACRKEMRRLFQPALAMMMIPFSQAAVLQGTALMLGIAVGQAAVPAYSATRTISRVGLQFIQLLNNALLPEYSAAVGRGDRPAQATMMLLTLLVACAALLPFAFILAIWGKPLIREWTGGAIGPDERLMLAMSLTVVLGGLWNPLSNLLLAMNHHASFTYPYIGCAIVIMPLTFVLTRLFGAAGAGMSMAMLDLVMCTVVLNVARRLLPLPSEMLVAWRSLADRVYQLLTR